MHLALMLTLVIAAVRDAAAADLLDELRDHLYQNNEDYIAPPSAGPASTREASKPLSKYREVNPAKKTEFVLPTLVRRMNVANETQVRAAPNAVPQPGNTTLATARAQSAASRANELGPPAPKPNQLKTTAKDEPKQLKTERKSLEMINPVTPSGISTGALKMRADGARKHRAGRSGRVTRAPGGRARPRPDLLDMAPARGPRVHSKRLRNRLCQRSVLKPEGPKYDSKGEIYLKRFAPRGRGNHAFDRTRPPALVLPRCCNCCRKSVLGCE